MTIESGQKTSLLVPSQLPEFVRDDPSYANFVLFLEAYYEWLEQNGNVEERTKNLLNYADIDETSAEFLQYFYNDFLSYFPDEILADKQKVLKIARQLYQTKGTQAAYRFLFRVLYDSDVEFFYTKDAVLRASSGKWYVARSVRLADADERFSECVGFRLFGETSKSIATIENVLIVGDKIEVFISDIQRLFRSGEIVRVVDENNQNVLMEDGMPHMGKIVGQISQVVINPNYRGLLYRPGDPVVIYGGLNSVNAASAIATVGETTSGSIQRVKLETGGYGYREDPNTIITLVNAPGAVVTVAGLSPAANSAANVTFIPTDVISLKSGTQIGALDYNFSNVALANANTSLANAFTFASFTTYPISSVLVENSGGGITTTPQITAVSQYTTDVTASPANLKNLGILAPIQILSAGQGYQNNDIILFSGGSGIGANAKVSQVNANGEILAVTYTYLTSHLTYPLGGLGYKPDALPTVTVSSNNISAANASLFVPGILGDGATFSSIVDRVGSITTINIVDSGEDYISTPNVSLKVQDIVVANLVIGQVPSSGEIVYQGLSNSPTYQATVESTSLLVPFADPLQSLYRLRVYNYTNLPNYSEPIKVSNSSVVMSMTNYYSTINTATRFDSTGLITYGDGTARANALFLNGLVVSQGQYLDTTGQPSSFDVLQSEKYNNYTYQITVNKEIAKYRETLLNLLHPAGMKLIGKYALKSNSQFDFSSTSALETGFPLGYYTGTGGSYATMTSTWENQSNNIINFYGLVGANLQNFIFSNSIIQLTLSNGFQIESEVGGQIYSNGANTVTLNDNVWLTFANVAYVTANANSNVINIISLTGSYDIINNGEYSNTDYPLKDIVYAGDKVLVANNSEKTVQSVDWEGGTITLTTNLANTVNSLMSVQRTVSTTDVVIFGPKGQQYFSELITQDGKNLITQDDRALILG